MLSYCNLQPYCNVTIMLQRRNRVPRSYLVTALLTASLLAGVIGASEVAPDGGIPKTRVSDNGDARPAVWQLVWEVFENQILLCFLVVPLGMGLVTDSRDTDLLTTLLGKQTSAPYVVDSDHDRAEIILAHSELLRKPLKDLHLRSRFGVTVSRVVRFEVPFVPGGETTLCTGDRITIVGPHENLQSLEKEAGHRPRRMHETDLMSHALCLMASILVGMIPINIPGLPGFSLGVAGGPLLVGLLVALFWTIPGQCGVRSVCGANSHSGTGFRDISDGCRLSGGREFCGNTGHLWRHAIRVESGRHNGSTGLGIFLCEIHPPDESVADPGLYLWSDDIHCRCRSTRRRH